MKIIGNMRRLSLSENHEVIRYRFVVNCDEVISGKTAQCSQPLCDFPMILSFTHGVRDSDEILVPA